MVAGRIPRPTALKMIAGERKDRVNFDEPKPDEAVVDCPLEDPEAIEVWDFTLRQLLVMKVWTTGDRDALAAYCSAVVMNRRAAGELHREGITTDMGFKHPAINVFATSAAAIKSFATEFGLTPASRTRIRVADQTPKAEETKSPARLLSS